MDRNHERDQDRCTFRRCNLCAEEFLPATVFERYCRICRDESELLKFAEWLPEIGDAIQAKLSA